LYILRVNSEVVNSPHCALQGKFTGARRFKFTEMLKHDARNTYGEMGQKFPAFLSSEIEGGK